MRRPLLTMLLMAGALCLVVAPVLAAEGGAGHGDEATSPVYQPAQGIITGVATIVIFILLVAVLGKYAWGPILAGLKAREEKIRKDIAAAEEARARAEATLRQYNDQLATAEQKVRDLLTKATADAEKLAGSIRTRGQQEAEEIKERAMRDIDAAREQALSEIYQQTADLATRVAEKILRRNLNADDQRGLVNESLQELQTVGAK
ncbi:MAG TPA: F0F1 ATP synthase subunit B [Tepidisphaeraceae bacterium]|jgi:F-type H+-transporting ATPase subunit b|nr:F0F1 ATP synthase subunit B [Tepidisphaeraceae bacterium]